MPPPPAQDDTFYRWRHFAVEPGWAVADEVVEAPRGVRGRAPVVRGAVTAVARKWPDQVRTRLEVLKLLRYSPAAAPGKPNGAAIASRTPPPYPAPRQ